MKSTTKSSFKAAFILMLLLSCFSMVCPGQELAARKNMITAGVNIFRGSSGDFRQVYGQSLFMPEIKIARVLYRNFAVWGSCAFIAKNGFIEEIDEKTHIRQTVLSSGIGYAHELSAYLRLRAELGLTSIFCKEEAMGKILKNSGLGWKIGANLDYFIGKKMFATLTTSYSQSSDEAQTGKIELGGFQAGAGFGFTF